MFVNKRACSLGMALHADRILIGAGFEHLVLEGAVGIVAIGAFQHPLGDAVMEGLREGRLHIGVALVAERRLLGLEQDGLGFELVHAMAAGAADTGVSVGGSLEIRMVACVAGEALRFDLFRCRLGELEDLGCISSAVNVGLTGAVAAFAGHALPAVLQRKLSMGIGFEALHLVRVADRAAISSGIAGRVSGWPGGRRGSLCLRRG